MSTTYRLPEQVVRQDKVNQLRAQVSALRNAGLYRAAWATFDQLENLCDHWEVQS